MLCIHLQLLSSLFLSQVGGASEVEVSEVKDRLNDALCATKAAVEEGIVPGGGSTLLFASQELDSIATENYDQKVGVNIIKNACKVPLKLIAQNAGHEGSVVVGNLLRCVIGTSMQCGIGALVQCDTGTFVQGGFVVFTERASLVEGSTHRLERMSIWWLKVNLTAFSDVQR